MKPCITFASDFGLVDEFVGVVHAVLIRLAPECHVVDLSHGIPPHDVGAGARLLLRSIRWMPDGALIAVVDPGVGGARRALGVIAAERPGLLLVGPDNGVLWPALEELGGATAAVHLARPALATDGSSHAGRTFDGRDVFAPAAANWCNGASLAELGEGLELRTLARLPSPEVAIGDDWLSAEVTWIDRFGNVELSAHAEQCRGLGPRTEVTIGRPDPAASPCLCLEAVVVTSFSDLASGRLGLIADSSGMAALVMNQRSAASTLGARIGDRVLLRTVSG